jgi:hypothetical protein
MLTPSNSWTPFNSLLQPQPTDLQQSTRFSWTSRDLAPGPSARSRNSLGPPLQPQPTGTALHQFARSTACSSTRSRNSLAPSRQHMAVTAFYRFARSIACSSARSRNSLAPPLQHMAATAFHQFTRLSLMHISSTVLAMLTPSNLRTPFNIFLRTLVLSRACTDTSTDSPCPLYFRKVQKHSGPSATLHRFARCTPGPSERSRNFSRPQGSTPLHACSYRLASISQIHTWGRIRKGHG